MIKTIIFDWGNTIMRDYPDEKGPMYLWKKVSWIDGAENLLQIIQNRYCVCIASNAGDSNTELMIKALKIVGADKYFNFFFTSKDLGYSKPDERFFTEIARKINMNCSECLMIGNDYKKDIIGAKKAAMKTMFFNEFNQEGDYPDADFIVNTLSEVVKIIN